MVVGLAEYQSRFLARTEVSGDCLLWKSGANSSGYGTAHFPRSWGMVPETTSAHRVAYMIFRGPVREGQEV